MAIEGGGIKLPIEGKSVGLRAFLRSLKGLGFRLGTAPTKQKSILGVP